MPDDFVIQVDEVWKRYGLPLMPWLRRQRDRLTNGQGANFKAYGPWALEDVSFRVRHGESLGIVGKNGAGKSTLLKLLAGVSPATRGAIQVRGRLFPMIELAAGIHRDLTGRENIRLFGAIMGFTPGQMRAKLPEIEAFAELGDWLDKPVWQYSSGMQARLGFSVAVNVDADILLIDEVLSVGDVNFQKKCLTRMDELSNSGVTVIFVTHNPYNIERICDRAIYLRAGRITAEGSPSDILTAYFQQSMDKSSVFSGADLPAMNMREGTGSFRITDIAMRDGISGDAITSFHTGDSVAFDLALKVFEPTANYRLSLRILDPAGTIVSHVDIPSSERPQLALREDATLQCAIDSVNLLPGEYWIDLVAREVAGPVIDSISFALSFLVLGDSEVMQRTENRGFVYLPASWRVTPPQSPHSSDSVVEAHL